MSLLARTQETTGESKTRSHLTLKVPDGARILIVCDDDSEAERLKAILREAGFVSECAKSITAGCEAAKSGGFQVVVSTPLLRDGSWRRLADIANHYDLGFEVVLWARNFDETDDERHPRLAIVNSSLAERLFPNGDAIGKTVRFGFMPHYQNIQIVGIASNARIYDLRDAAAPVIFLSYLQYSSQWGNFLVRTNECPEALPQ